MTSPVLIALGAPEIERGDLDVDLGVCRVELRADGTLAVLLEDAHEHQALVVFPRRAVSAELIAWQEARRVTPGAAA